MEMLEATSLKEMPLSGRDHAFIVSTFACYGHMTLVLCYCISNLQRVGRKQLLLKKLQLTT